MQGSPLPRQPVSCHHVPSYYNSHYVQAYSQASASTSVMNGQASFSAHLNSPASASFLDSKLFWYQSGNNHCKQQGCAFFGSHKSVEIHMMDRHLVYPPGWEKRKKKPDWDADPSLKGKPIPIQGTNIVLDSPEILDVWIAERKKRFPTSSRVEDKKRKLEDAVARGQLDTTNVTNKRQKCDYRRDSHGSNRKVQSRTGGNRIRTADAGWGSRVRVPPIAPSKVGPTKTSHSNSTSEDDADDEPEVLSSKIQHPSETLVVQEGEEHIEKKGSETSVPSQSVARNDTVDRRRSSVLHPKIPPRNPFASRPTLLRNLLLPEISITVSNLSQAIRFLVDNDFLQNVELTPGQALDIEVLNS